ncbi:hypothetical protein [Mobilicoccus caccae]|uniref:Uncharacterized protein n=1 Tax=Mobilicoccus caccae TaxID=1859295 RepID=A0ABQ6IL12_9MICO|nr:hypothetical protein [Mobilicoccus caccae]GMA38040.1 hypothetical protein GCM10025883_00850 [Mobilicoccus caccae]
MSGAMTDVLDRFRRAREEERDELWAGRALLVLTTNDVSDSRIRQALDEAVELVESSGEGPEDLFGDPDAWARERIDGWVDDGVAYHSPDGPEDANTLVSVTGILATFISLVVVGVHALKGQWNVDYTIGWLVFPVLGAATTMATLTVWERLAGRRPWLVALAGAGATFVVGVAITTTALLAPGGELGRASLGWLLLLPVALGALTWAASRFIPEGAGSLRAEPVLTGEENADARWLREAEAALRRRGDLRGSEVRTILAEAREHAARAGTDLATEFGAPRTYADGFPRHEGRARLRRAIVMTALLGVWAWSLSGAGDSVLLWLALVGWSLFTAHEWWGVWRHRSSRPRDDE